MIEQIKPVVVGYHQLEYSEDLPIFNFGIATKQFMRDICIENSKCGFRSKFRPVYEKVDL